jgi:hypothetical protein
MSYKPGDIVPRDGEVQCRVHTGVTAHAQAGKRFSSAHEGAGSECAWEYRSKPGTGAHRGRLTLDEVQEQIFQREGFRVSFVPLGGTDHPLPPYDYPVMAPNGWHLSDWRRVRLRPYVVLFKDVFVYRGDGTRVTTDLKLGHLRDSYYAAQYGTLAPEATTIVPPAPVPAPAPSAEKPRRHAPRPHAPTRG